MQSRYASTTPPPLIEAEVVLRCLGAKKESNFWVQDRWLLKQKNYFLRRLQIIYLVPSLARVHFYGFRMQAHWSNWCKEVSLAELYTKQTRYNNPLQLLGQHKVQKATTLLRPWVRIFQSEQFCDKKLFNCRTSLLNFAENVPAL